MAGNGGNKLRSNKSGILRWDLVTFLLTFFIELLEFSILVYRFGQIVLLETNLVEQIC